MASRATDAPGAGPQPAPETESWWDQFLAWIRSWFESGAPDSAATPSGGGSGAPDCSLYLSYVQSYGLHGARAIFMREIQHRGGQQGYAQGGWIGAIIGGVVATGDAASAVRECERLLGDQVQQAQETHKATRRQIREERKACKDRCDEQYTNHSLIGPGGKPWRECRKACREAAREARQAMHGQNGSPGGHWGASFLP